MKGISSIGWNYGEIGAWFSAGIATAGTIFTTLVGGNDKMIQALLWFMGIDFVLGFIAACKLHKTDSHVMFWGGINKFLVLVMVVMAVILDGIVGLQEPYIRTAVIWFYIAREGLSIVENYGKLGLPLPTFIKTMLKQIAEQADKGEKHESND